MEKLTLWSAMKLPNSESYVVAFQGHALYKNDIISPNNECTNKLIVVGEPILIKDGYVTVVEPIGSFDDIYLTTGTYYRLIEESVGEFSKMYR